MGVPSIAVAVSIRPDAVRVGGERRDVPGDAQGEPFEEGAVRDERLRLILTCCHPALG